jgi:hypothetical protein
MRVMTKPTAFQAPQRAPTLRQVLWDAINWPQSTDGQNGTMVKMRIATYWPRFRVGANSEVAARAVSSQIPAPAPAIAMPPGQKTSAFGSQTSAIPTTSHQYPLLTSCSRECNWRNVPMKVFMTWAVLETIMPMMMKEEPRRATYRRPMRSDNDPTNGQTPARARRFAST